MRIMNNSTDESVQAVNVTSVNNDSEQELTEQIAVFLYVYIPLKVVIVLGNLLTIVAVAADRTRHTTPYIFTASLAVADLLIGLSVVYDIILLAAPNLQPMLACLTNFVMCAGLAESAQSTTLIALDRTLVIKYALRYPVWMTLSRTAAIVFLTAVLSVAYSAIIMSLAGWSSDTCDMWTAVSTHEFLLPKVAPFCVFLMITGCLYSYVLVIAYRQRVAIARVHSALPITDQFTPQVYSVSRKMSLSSRWPEIKDPAQHPVGLANMEVTDIDGSNIDSAQRSYATDCSKYPLSSYLNTDVFDSASRVLGATSTDRDASREYAAGPLHSSFGTSDVGNDTLMTPQYQNMLAARFGLVKSSADDLNTCFSGAGVFYVGQTVDNAIRRDTFETLSDLQAHRKISFVMSSGESSFDSGSVHSKLPSVEDPAPDEFSVSHFHTSSSLPNLHTVATVSDINAELVNASSMRKFSVTTSICGETSLRPSLTSFHETSRLKRNCLWTSLETVVAAVDRPPVRKASLPVLSVSSPRTARFILSSPSCGRKHDCLLNKASMLGDQSVPTALLQSVPNIPAIMRTYVEGKADCFLVPKTDVERRSFLGSLGERRWADCNTTHSAEIPMTLFSTSSPKETPSATSSIRKITSNPVSKVTSTPISNRLSVETRSSITTVKSYNFGLYSGLWKSFRMFFMVWGIYFLTLMPIIVSAFVFTCYPVSQATIDFAVRIDIMFIFVNSGVNVFIYAWKDKQLRKSLWFVLRCRWNDI